MQLPVFSDVESAQQWVRAHAEREPRLAGEALFIIARIYAEDRGDQKTADLCAARTIELFGRCPMQTLEECAACFTTILGKALPSIIHEDVVLWHFPNARQYMRR